MGTVEPRKNLPVLVRAFDVVAAAHDDALLVVAGPDGWGSQAFDDAVSHARFGDRVRRLGYVTNARTRRSPRGRIGAGVPLALRGFRSPAVRGHGRGRAGRDRTGGRAARSRRRRRPPRRPHRRRRAGGCARPRARRSRAAPRCSCRAVTSGCRTSRGRPRSTNSSPSTDAPSADRLESRQQHARQQVHAEAGEDRQVQQTGGGHHRRVRRAPSARTRSR